MTIPARLARTRTTRLARALVVASAAGAVALPFLSAPAFSADMTATNLTGLQAALGSSCTDGTVVKLDADVVAPTATLEASCVDLTLELASADALTVQNIVIRPGAGLTITGASSDLLIVDASAQENLAGIENSGATLVLRDLRVRATGGRLGAGIGGGFQGQSGTILIGGTARVAVVADGNAQGAAIGGGYLADGGPTTIEDDAQVTVTTRTNSGGAALGGGYLGDGGTIVVRGRASVDATSRSGANGAAIGGGFQGDGGTIVIGGAASVRASARSGAKGAAIGGGYQGDGGTVTVAGHARVIATSSVSGNIVGATIGGGPGGDGAAVNIERGVVTAGSSKEGTAFGPGSPVAGEAGAFGTLRVEAGTLRLPSGVLDIDDTRDVTEVVVAPGGRILGSERPPSSPAGRTYATIAGAGDIVNRGSIALPPEFVRAKHLLGHHYRVRFDTRGSRRTPASAPPSPTRVFAGSFDAGRRPFVSRPVRPGFRFVEWNTRPGGKGVRVRASSTLPGASVDGTPRLITAYAIWRRR